MMLLDFNIDQNKCTRCELCVNGGRWIQIANAPRAACQNTSTLNLVQGKKNFVKKLHSKVFKAALSPQAVAA
ncbi:hypothetical protein SAMN05660860_01822 [Geoalkalibacter ferrihydriticus]|uniref:Uncharacterized protein n=1 Tax=Geoalkalibacter ferrihydriticus TaxID=392333 RepID=A0A1G9Q4L4_9BACT|nr:hypothetical protein [Geoalkalibacter ferrihydriticus]SDM05984.1 hypothetical protein SAMN05660860_01822 [Geoalkalibacter ferrihydriticus]